MRKSTSLLAFTLFIIIFCSCTVFARKRVYGEFCDKYKKCDFTKWFSCKEHKCKCFYEEDTYYDETSGRCLGRSATNCSQTFYPFDEPGGEDLFNRRGITANHWRYGNGTLRCGAHSQCYFDGQNHFCKCQKGYADYGEDRMCLRLKSYGDACIKDEQCDQHKYLKCINSTCGCDRRTHRYDAFRQICQVQADDKCTPLLPDGETEPVDDCPPRSTCIDNVCKCDKGWQIDSDRTCRGGFGKHCDYETPCGDSKLSCRSNKCQCKYPKHSIYDSYSGQCLSKVSGPCDYNNTSEFAIHCAANAECVSRRFYSECQCKEGFIQTEHGYCVKKFGEECEMDHECDREADLACINHKCSCPDMLQIYDPMSRRCNGLVGSRCVVGAISCVKNAKCYKYVTLDFSNIGRCLCQDGFAETKQRTCSSS